MKKLMRNLLVAFTVTTAALEVTAQQNVGIGVAVPDASARLDIVGTNRGLLIPRVALASLNDKTTVPTPATGLLVFNTNAAVTGGTGFYYNSGTTAVVAWKKLQDGSSGGAGWALTGNTDIDSIANFLGTTDNNPIVFRVNNKYAGQIGSNGGIALGRGANSSRITPPGVIAIGDSALFNNTDSSEIAIGNSALFNNTTGQSNTAIGNFSLVSNRIGFANVAVGDFTLTLSDTSDNTAVGFAALNAAVGEQNTAVGSQALVNNFAGFLNTAVGYAAGASIDNGSGNTSLGTLSLVQNVSGNANTAVGLYSLFGIEGDENTAVGFNAIGNGASGFSNSAFGADAFTSLDGGNYNTGIGDSVAYSLTTGSFNTAVGTRAAGLLTTGSSNTAVGYLSLNSVSTGTFNTAIGNSSLTLLTTGSFNTAIGNLADASGAGAGTLTNATAVGYNTKVSTSNTVRIGNAAVTSIGGQVSWSTLSDGRYKRNVSNNVKGLDFIMQLNPVTYNYDFDKINTERNLTPVTTNATNAGNSYFNRKQLVRPLTRGNIMNPRTAGLRSFSPQSSMYRKLSGGFTARSQSTAPDLAKYYEEVNQNNQIRYTGFIAQEVEAAAKKAGFDFSGVDKPTTENGEYSLRYSDFVVPLVKAVQEQQAIIDAQNQKINELILRLEKLELSK
jgi:trimeric autotransporter adhesin